MSAEYNKTIWQNGDVISVEKLNKIENGIAAVSNTVNSPAIYDTATGSIASFSDGADDLPMKNAVVNIEPIQDLHGYDSPWPAGGGVNRWDEEWENGYYNRVTGIKDGNSNTSYFRSKNYIPCYPNTSYYLKAPSVHASNTTYYAVLFYDADKTYISAINSGVSDTVQTTPENAHFMTFYIEVGTSGATYHNDIAINYPATVTTYSPYSNICPISGRTGVSVTHVGKNILPPNFDGSENGLVFTTQTDGSVKVNGTATATTNKTVIMYIPEGDYALNGCPLDGSASTYQIWISSIKTGSSTGIEDRGSGSSGHLDAGMHSVRIRIASGYTANDLTFYPMLRVAGSDSNYEPYKGSTYTVNWETEAGTVYGGTLDAVSGKLTVDWTSDDMGQYNWGGSNGVFNFNLHNISPSWSRDSIDGMRCSTYKPESWNSIDTGTYSDYSIHGLVYNGVTILRVYDSRYQTIADFKLGVSGTHFAYELATPIEIQLAPQEVRTLLGENNIWSDGGDMAVEYPADTKLYIDRKIAEALS